jgi:hypothetical protein
MLEKRRVRWIHELFAGKSSQCLAFSFCLLFGLAMIANTQLSGEATWFWYATLFHRGAKLYADLHLVLQPLYILEMNVWMNLFGKKLLVTEIPSVLHLVVLCLGMLLLLRESDWPDWQKAIVLAAVFVFWTAAISYRFDDFHATTESFALYSVILLLQVAKSDQRRRQLFLAAALGVLSGLAMTSRMNDGAALLAATLLCLPLLARTRKFLLPVLFVATAALTVVLVVKATGDTFPDYISNSLTSAAGSKGGAGSLLADPFLLFRNSMRMLQYGKWIAVAIAAVIAAGALAARYGKRNIRNIVLVQLGVAAAILVFSPLRRKAELVAGTLPIAIPFMAVVIYLLSAVALARYLMSKMRPDTWKWSAREVLILVPLAELMSLSTSAAAKPGIHHYCWQMALLLLLVPVIQPFRSQIRWANASFLTILALLALSGATVKAMLPYAWDDQGSNPMFVNRHWVRHPVYGPMYIQPDLLEFGTSICNEIGQGGAKPELLSLPLSYPNYFCDTPPWHGYVQTFFDTSARSAVATMVDELRTNPPQWIVYHRQLLNLVVHEQAYNHGRPLPQRDLDDLIMQRMATGQWQLVDWKPSPAGEGWYIIRTRP